MGKAREGEVCLGCGTGRDLCSFLSKYFDGLVMCLITESEGCGAGTFVVRHVFAPRWMDEGWSCLVRA